MLRYVSSKVHGGIPAAEKGFIHVTVHKYRYSGMKCWNPDAMNENLDRSPVIWLPFPALGPGFHAGMTVFPWMS